MGFFTSDEGILLNASRLHSRCNLMLQLTKRMRDNPLKIKFALPGSYALVNLTIIHLSCDSHF